MAEYFFRKASSGLLHRFENNATYPFSAGDWSITTGQSIVQDGNRLKVSGQIGAVGMMYDPMTARSEVMVYVEGQISASVYFQSGPFGLLTDINSFTGARYIQEDYGSNVSYLTDFDSGVGTGIDTDVGYNSIGRIRHSLGHFSSTTRRGRPMELTGAVASGSPADALGAGKAGVWLYNNGSVRDHWVNTFHVHSGSSAIFSGVPQGWKVKLYDIAGTLLATDTAGADGICELDLFAFATSFPVAGLLHLTDGSDVVQAASHTYGGMWGGETWEIKSSTAFETAIITNPGGETGDETGWTNAFGSPYNITAENEGYSRTGSYAWKCKSQITGAAYMYQDHSVPSGYHDLVDAGEAAAKVEAYIRQPEGLGDYAKLGLQFFNASMVSLGVSRSWDKFSNHNDSANYKLVGAGTNIPALTRTVRIFVESQRNTTQNYGARLDDVELTYVGISEAPAQPSIVSVSNVTGQSATVNGSTYSHNGGQAHDGTQVQVRYQGASDWSTLVVDTGDVAASESVAIDGLALLTNYEARLRYKDDTGDWSEWSVSYAFQTTDIPDTGIPFDWTNWAQIWNTMAAVYFGEFIGPGGWHTINFLPNVDCNNPFDQKLASFGRLLGPPSAVVYTPTPNRGADVKARFGWWSSQEGYSWQKYYDCEYARSGLVACACGTASANSPQAAHDIWAPIGTYEWTLSSDFQGVFAYFEPFPAWPYNPSENGYYGDAPATLIVDVYHAGELEQRWRYEMPERIIFSHYCYHFPWWGLRLKVWHDYAADSTGKTHRIQVAYTVPPNERRGTAALPSDSDPWTHDITWVGGHDESTVGAGDGGLRCGYSGYGSDRHTGVVTNHTYGASVYRDFLFEALEEDFCGAPCDADYTPETPPEVPLPPPTQPISTPCPPVEEGEFQNVFLGGKNEGSLFQFGGYEVEANRDIVAKIQPNAVAPAGYGGECHFKSVVVAVEHIGDISIGLVPILNGERLDAYAQEELFVGPGDRVQIRRYEVPLYRAFEDAVVEGTENDRFKYGLRGAFFSVEISIVDICGLGIAVSGVEYDYDVVRESQATGIVYTEHLLRTPAFASTGGAFIGAGPGLLKAGSGVTDDGAVAEARVVSNPVAPAGIGGECAFNRISVVVTRWNAADMDLLVTPIIDGIEGAASTISYKATTAPVTEVTEVQISQYHTSDDGTEAFRYRPRGAWIAVKIETGDGLQEWLSIEGVDLDYDVVRESMTKRLVDRGGSGFTDGFDGGFR